MMKTRRIARGILLLVAACRPIAGSEAPGTGAAAATGADDGREPSNRRPGELLEETVPLFAGDALELASLRGRVVLLELSATWVEQWEKAHRRYDGLLRRSGDDDLVVVVVSLDTNRARLEADWQRNPHSFLLAWDPQGALAARLQVAALPTVFVVGRDGRIRHVLSESDLSDFSVIDEHVGAAVASR